jgi:UDP-N-acetylglucosamine 2-epimerase (non-hydrolysing)
MSKLFFDDLNIPRPDVNLEVGSGTHAAQTAEIMRRFEPVVLDFKPDYVVVSDGENGDFIGLVFLCVFCIIIGLDSIRH